MKKIYAACSVAVLAVCCSVATAQSDVDPLGQADFCPKLTHDMRLATRDLGVGGDVSSLQFFLQSAGYLNSEPTGYFGLMTFAAVGRFQEEHGITPATGFVGPLTRAQIAKNCGEETSTTHVSDPDAPSIALVGKSGSQKGASMTVESGDDFEVSGIPKNLKGKNGRDFTAAWSFGPILDSACGNNSPKATNRWKLKCEAGAVGSTDVYVVISKDGVSYTSNSVRVNVVSDEDDWDDNGLPPEIDMVRGKASDDFQVYAGEPGYIEGENLVADGKDAVVWLGGVKVDIDQYDSGVVRFKVPSLPSGSYKLLITTSAGSDSVRVSVD